MVATAHAAEIKARRKADLLAVGELARDVGVNQAKVRVRQLRVAYGYVTKG
jgi:hypothetical protein